VAFPILPVAVAGGLGLCDLSPCAWANDENNKPEIMKEVRKIVLFISFRFTIVNYRINKSLVSIFYRRFNLVEDIFPWS